jgi:deoxyribonuclease V
VLLRAKGLRAEILTWPLARPFQDTHAGPPYLRFSARTPLKPGNMIAALDVQYHENHAQAAGVLFHHWTDAEAAEVHTVQIKDIAPYEPGAFYKRELPCLLAVIKAIHTPLEYIIVDSYVFLDQHNTLGLGGRLYEALGGRVSVVGVAKTEFLGAPSVAVRRVRSKKPLFVSSIGCDLVNTAQAVAQMHGEHRLPTLLKRVDQVARAAGNLGK